MILFFLKIDDSYLQIPELSIVGLAPVETLVCSPICAAGDFIARTPRDARSRSPHHYHKLSKTPGLELRAAQLALATAPRTDCRVSR